MFCIPIQQSIAQALCPASVVGGEGIGDGCTTKSGGINAALIFPDVGIFKGTFTPACNTHDKCFTTLGTNGPECNSNFLSDMKSACNSDFNALLHPVELLACRTTAEEYKKAVDINLSQYPSTVQNHQNDALLVSRELERVAKASGCVTTPERTTLYSPSLIAKINGAFDSYAGRKPTIFEFLGAINAGNVVNDPAGWESNLIALAMQKLHSARPPVVGYSRNGTVFTVLPIVAGATYTWVIDGMAKNTRDTVFDIGIPKPKYGILRKISGYVKATLNEGTALEVSDYAIIDTAVYIDGWCYSAKPGFPKPATCQVDP